jgi:hypothetical protein
MKRCVLSKTTSFHPLFIKKKEREAQNGAVLSALWVFFFPWMREAGEEEAAAFPCFSPPFFSERPKKTPTNNPYLPKL